MSYDTTKMSVDEIRAELVNKFGMTRESVDTIKGKKPLAGLLAGYATDAAWAGREELGDDANFSGDDLLEEADDLFTGDEDDLVDAPLDHVAVTGIDSNLKLYPDDTPCPTDPEWSDYVISRLTENEMFEGSPKVSGLRRVTELLMGDIMKSETLIMQCPSPDNERRATVVHRVTVRDDEGDERVSEGAADVYSGNSDRMFGNHPVALAETRAEGRALRRLLRLSSSVVTAEEKIKPTEKFDDFFPVDTTKITDVQVTGFDIVGKRNDINLSKLLDKEFPKANNINELSNEEGIKLLNILSSYQSTGVPDDLKGYDPNWRLKTKV
jgi:hypothetical protein